MLRCFLKQNGADAPENITHSKMFPSWLRQIMNIFIVQWEPPTER